jgi:hypothetical protein
MVGVVKRLFDEESPIIILRMDIWVFNKKIAQGAKGGQKKKRRGKKGKRVEKSPGLGTSDPKSDIDVGIVGGVVDAIRRAAKVGNVAPRTTAQQPGIGIIRGLPG